MKRLWEKLHIKSITRLLSFLVFALGLGLCFGWGNIVKASENDETFGKGEWATITSGTNQILVCVSSVYQDHQPVLSWNNHEMTLVPSDEKVGSNQFGWNYNETSDHFWYLVNPDTGTYQLGFPYDTWSDTAFCKVYENVSQLNPIATTSSAFSISEQYWQTSQGDIPTRVLAPYVREGSSFGTSSPAWNFGGENYVDGVYQYIGILDATTGGSDWVHLNLNGYLNGLMFFVELTTYNLENEPYIMYYGANPVYTILNTNFNLPVFYNLCSVWDNEETYYLSLTGAGNEFVDRIELNNCADNLVFDSKAPDIANIENTETFVIKNSIGDVIAESNAFINAVYNEITTINWINFSFSPFVYVDQNITTSTTLNFAYNLCYGWDQATSSKICIKNRDSNNQTEFCQYISTCANVGALKIPSPSSNYIFNGNFTYYDQYNNEKVSSNGFSVVFYGTTTSATSTNPINNISISCDIPPINASTTCSDLGTSTFDNLVCGLRISGAWLFQPNCESLNYFSDNYNTLQGAPPFNIFFQFTNTIKTALNNSSTTTSTVFSIPMVNQMGASNTIYMMPVISSSTLSNAIGQENNNLFRQTLTWVIWIIGGCLVGLIIWKV